MKGYIYGLSHNGVIFYVGSTLNPENRIKSHLIQAKGAAKTKVGKYMKANAIIPTMDILQSIGFRKKTTLLEGEQKWISKLSESGIKLVNTHYTTSGGVKSECSSARLYGRMRLFVDLPRDTLDILKKLAAKDNRMVKNYLEKHIIDLTNKKVK